MPVPGLVPGISTGIHVYAAELTARREWPAFAAFAGHDTDESDPMLAGMTSQPNIMAHRRPAAHTGRS